MATNPPAGWYGDPQHPGQERRWDGTAWTDETRERPAETTPPPAIPPPPRADGSATSGGNWWSRRSLPAKIGLGILGLLIGMAVLGSLVPDPEGDELVAADPEPTSNPASPTGETVTEDEPLPAPPRPAEPTAEASPAPPAASVQVGPHGAPERLVLSIDDDVEIRGFNDAEESLARQLADATRSQPWWPLVGEIYVEEDMFISDVRIGVDVLYHSDILDLSVAMCDVFLAALPETDQSLVVDIKPTYVSGGGKAIDGSDEPYEFSYTQTAASGNNFSDEPCEVRRLDQPAEDNSEEYLADPR